MESGEATESVLEESVVRVTMAWCVPEGWVMCTSLSHIPRGRLGHQQLLSTETGADLLRPPSRLEGALAATSSVREFVFDRRTLLGCGGGRGPVCMMQKCLLSRCAPGSAN